MERKKNCGNNEQNKNTKKKNCKQLTAASLQIIKTINLWHSIDSICWPSFPSLFVCIYLFDRTLSISLPRSFLPPFPSRALSLRFFHSLSLSQSHAKSTTFIIFQTATFSFAQNPLETCKKQCLKVTPHRIVAFNLQCWCKKALRLHKNSLIW